jgi:hypothetical protein
LLTWFLLLQLERWSRDEPVNKTPWRQQEDVDETEQQQAQQQQEEEEQAGAQQLEHQQGESYQYSLQLLVPPGQLELGRRLVTAMYSSSPDLSDLEAPQLMQLVALAECYGVGRIITAAATQLRQLSVETMPLRTATAVFELPEACQALDAFKPVCKTAADKLQQELGDLEVVWGDKDKQKSVLFLPIGALLQLLGDERTRVASEDTILHTAVMWWGGIHHRRSPSDLNKAPQLLAVLRLPQCTATFLTDSRSRKFLLRGGVTKDEACDLYSMPALREAQRADWLQVAYAHRPAWRLPRRPPSTVMHLHHCMRLPLASVRKAFESGQQGTSCLSAPNLVWHGRVWQYGVYVSCNGTLGVYMRCYNKACCSAVLAVHSVSEGSGLRWELHDRFVSRMLFCQLCSAMSEDASWARLRAQLEEHQLVHPGDMLLCSLSVGNVA